MVLVVNVPLSLLFIQSTTSSSGRGAITGPLVASVVVSTTDCRSRSHHEDKSRLEVETTSSLHLVVEILRLVHLVIVSLVDLVVEIMIMCRTWLAAVRKFKTITRGKSR